LHRRHDDPVDANEYQGVFTLNLIRNRQDNGRPVARRRASGGTRIHDEHESDGECDKSAHLQRV